MIVGLPEDLLAYLASCLPLESRSRLGQSCRLLRVAAVSTKIDGFELQFAYNTTCYEEANGTERKVYYFGQPRYIPFRQRKILCLDNAARLTGVQEVQNVLYDVGSRYCYCFCFYTRLIDTPNRISPLITQRFNILLHGRVSLQPAARVCLAFRLDATFGYSFDDWHYWSRDKPKRYVAAQGPQPSVYQNFLPENISFTSLTEIEGMEKLVSVGRDTVEFLSMTSRQSGFNPPGITYDFRRLRLPELTNLKYVMNDWALKPLSEISDQKHQAAPDRRGFRAGSQS
jgi:hypothetical protein